MSEHAIPTLRRLAGRAALAACVLVLPSAAAAEPIFKCGKTYTNLPPGSSQSQLKSSGCVLVDPAGGPRSAKSQDIAIDGSRQITVPIGEDGRFWIRGSVNGFPVQFVIDQGATVDAGVVVTEDFAARANLIGGAPAHVQTRGGVIEGRRIQGIPASFGPFRIPQTTVVVGPLGSKSSTALLGQDLLSLFEVTANDREMTIVSKQGQPRSAAR
jgi:gag-polyprotein putative aspartyl protease